MLTTPFAHHTKQHTNIILIIFTSSPVYVAFLTSQRREITINFLVTSQIIACHWLPVYQISYFLQILHPKFCMQFFLLYVLGVYPISPFSFRSP
jgi:hypothetical protein